MIRPARKSELAELSTLCLRSKAHWGYDAAFIAACRDELTIHPADLSPGFVVWEDDGQVQGMVHAKCTGGQAALETMFIDPAFIGKGLGRVLFDWAAGYARNSGATVMSIDADPFAATFYESMGAQVVGEVASGSIPGRVLPLMEYALTLDPADRNLHP